MRVKVNTRETEYRFRPRFRSLQIVEPIVEPLKVTENGEYTAPEGVDGFSPVKVDVPIRYDEGFTDGYNQGYDKGYPEGYEASQRTIVLQEKTTTENGKFTPDEGFTGFSKFTVDVPERKEEQTKALDIVENGSYNLFPDEGKVLSSASVNVNIPPKEEQEKTLSVTKNGNYEVIPDEGKTMSKVTVNTNVAFEGDIGKPYIDTSKMTNFTYFCRGGNLLDQIENIDTSNATNLERMFYSAYVDFNVSNLNTSKGTNFKEMFMYCSRVYEIGELNTDNGQLFSSMFSGCSLLTTVKLTSIANATDASSMFYGCESLENLDIENFDTSKCTNLASMFYTCKKLKSIPFLDVSTSNYISDLFAGCFALETVSLSTAKTNFTTHSFYNCIALKNLTIGEGWAVDIYLHYSSELTVESLHGMIENLADLTGQTAKTFQIGSTNLAKIDAEHLAMLQNKNWNYS